MIKDIHISKGFIPHPRGGGGSNNPADKDKYFITVVSQVDNDLSISTEEYDINGTLPIMQHANNIEAKAIKAKLKEKK
jgi:hypothetical protein